MISKHTHCAAVVAAQLRQPSPSSHELDWTDLLSWHSLHPLSQDIEDEHELDLYRLVDTNSGQIVRMLLTGNAGFLGTFRLRSWVYNSVIIWADCTLFISWSYVLNQCL
jgi:hypothetical protein